MIQTLSGLAEQRRKNDRPTHVHVVGTFERGTPTGIATAKRVAFLLADDNSTVIEDDYEDLEDGDVAFVQLDSVPVTRESDDYRTLLNLAAASRAKRLGGIVVFSEVVGDRLEQYLDARVCAESGGVDRVERLQTNPYENETHAVELDGLVAAEVSGGSDA